MTPDLDSQLETGSELLDLEHQELLQLIHCGIEMSRNGSADADLLEKLDEIHDSLSAHFESEEGIMSGVDEQHADRHKKQHRYVMVSYQADISALASAHAPDRKSAAYETLISLYYWYVVHIKTVDKELVALIKAGVEV